MSLEEQIAFYKEKLAELENQVLDKQTHLTVYIKLKVKLENYIWIKELLEKTFSSMEHIIDFKIDSE